jgi:4-hydroxybenzoate polyprenyltransferase
MSIALLTLALVGTLALLGSMLGGYAVPASRAAVGPHFLLALVATLLLVMAHSFIMFFLLATGVEMKEIERLGGGDSIRRRLIAIKSRAFPSMTLALLLVIVNFMTGGAAHTRAVPPLVHEGLAWLTFAVCCYALFREYQVLGDNNRLIEESSGRRQNVST